MKPAGRGGGAGGRRERNNQGGKGRSRTVDGLVKSAGGLVDRLRHPFGSRGQERVGSSTELSPFGDEEVDLLPFELGAMLVRDRCVFVSASLRLCVGMLVCVFVCMLCLSMSVHVSGREDHIESPRCTSRSGRAQVPLPVSDMQGGTRIRGRKLTCWRT